MAILSRVGTTPPSYLQHLTAGEQPCPNGTLPIPVCARARKSKRSSSRVINLRGVCVRREDSAVHKNFSVAEQDGDSREAQLVHTPGSRECSGRRIVQFRVGKPVAPQAAARDQ